MTERETTTDSAGIAGAASLVALGNLVSRVLGLARESLSASLFGASGLVSAFGVANIIPKQLYELLIGGMLNSALVPAFAAYAAVDRDDELAHLFSAFLTLAGLVLAVLVLLLELLAPGITQLVAGGFDPAIQAVTENLIRLMLPTVWLLSLSGIITALLYARQQFLWPAVATAIYNAGIIIAIWFLAPRWSIYSLGAGVLLAAGLQLAVQLPALRAALRGRRLRFLLDWRHPMLRQILVLYSPVVLGLVISLVQVTIDRRLASGTGPNSIAWMDKATTLVQSAHGLVAVAISTAVLPLLAACVAQENEDGYRHTLGQSLRLALLLIVPLVVTMFLLAEPLVALFFQRGAFQPADTYWTAWALRLYLLGLIFATIDWPLNYGFYARRNTLTPALVGVLSVAVYLLVAWGLLRSLGMLGLVLADSAKHLSHAAVMLLLTQQQIGGVRGQALGRTVAKVGLAGLLMGAVVWGARHLIGPWSLPSALLTKLVQVAVPAALGAAVYAGIVAWLGIDEVTLLVGAIRRRLMARSCPERPQDGATKER